MNNTDLKFFTNEPERDLYSRFAAILKSNTQFFDVLVGYFRASGFFKMYEALENIGKIRILVGLNVDRFTVKIIDRATNEAKVAAISVADGKEIIAGEVEKEFESATSSAEVEKGVRIFLDWLKSGKLEMRMFTDAPIHAKVYIMRKDPVKVPDTFGSVITGSSNFSEAGLINNLEFNVELKDYADVKFAFEKFEELWARGTDIRDTYIEAVEQNTWMRGDITPYQLYLKTLYEFFKEEINADKENFDTLLPDGYMRLQYQIDAVIQARQKLDAYDTVSESVSAPPTKHRIITRENQKLRERYATFLGARDPVMPTLATKPAISTSEITTDDERIVLYYILKKNVRRVSKDTIRDWLHKREIYDVDVNNAFDLLYWGIL